MQKAQTFTLQFTFIQFNNNEIKQTLLLNSDLCVTYK